MNIKRINYTNNVTDVTDRKAGAAWAGARQDLDAGKFGSVQQPLTYWLNFSIQAGCDASVVWKLRVDDRYFKIFGQDVEASQWTNLHEKITLDSSVQTASYINLYSEITADCDYSLDNIVLEKWEIDDNWDNDIDEKIDHLRKKDVHFNFVDIDATGLVVSFEQLNHGFPFGHAVISQTISDCHLDGTDNEYCQHVKDNYNWVVDSYRCSNVAFEICFKTS